MSRRSLQLLSTIGYIGRSGLKSLLRHDGDAEHPVVATPPFSGQLHVKEGGTEKDGDLCFPDCITYCHGKFLVHCYFRSRSVAVARIKIVELTLLYNDCYLLTCPAQKNSAC